MFKTNVVQAKRLKTYHDESIPFSYPRIHGVTFDPANGLLKRLPLDFKKIIKELRHVYDLHEEPQKKEYKKDEQSPDSHTTDTG